MEQPGDRRLRKGRVVDGAASGAAAEHGEKNFVYSQKISQAQDVGELTAVLDEILRETQTEAIRSRDEMIAARRQARAAEARIRELEARLEQVTKVTREDHLTGSLNRRGLNDVIERELARSARHSSPLCVAMLDLDDFKSLNDEHGHVAGDRALIHLVRVIKETLRIIDVIGRFGGEEFLILLPDTNIDDAMQAILRLQRELARQIFIYDHQRLPITFSVGVASRNANEDPSLLIKRADDAMYKAKMAGKNLAVAAD
jgi:diguanylate cyclase